MRREELSKECHISGCRLPPDLYLLVAPEDLVDCHTSRDMFEAECLFFQTIDLNEPDLI